jgi:hypothetical protein
MINAFVSYAALRYTGLNTTQAWNKLGLYSGDDGVNSLIPGLHDELTEVSKELGLKVEIKVNGRNERMTYLGRVFPRPITSKSSYQDPIRTLSKIHLTANKNVTREQAATNKCAGYLTTDAVTPIISDYCRKVLEITGLAPKNMLSDETFKIINGAWPQEDEQIIVEDFCDLLQISSDYLNEVREHINSVTDLNSFGVYLNTELEVKIPALVDHNVLVPRTRLQESLTKCQTQQINNNSKHLSIAGRDKPESTSSPRSDSTLKNVERGKSKVLMSRRTPSRISKKKLRSLSVKSLKESSSKKAEHSK